MDRASFGQDALNFFLADVRDGLGPYLAIYLLTQHHWDEASIGLVTAIAAGAGIVAQTPAGALVDASKAKRRIVVGAAIAVTVTCLAIPVLTSFWSIAFMQSLAGAAGSLFAPAVAAISLGIVGHRAFARRMGRNETFNHAGNALAAMTAGAAAYYFGPIVVFYLMGFMALASIASVLMIPSDSIDHDRARGLMKITGETERPSSGFNVLLTSRPLLIFAICATLFHFANAAMLPLVAQKLSLANAAQATVLTSVCIVAAQLVMVPVAMFAGATADRLGRKPLFLAGLIVLASRGVLYTFSNNPYWLVGVQLLDGVGAGLFGVLMPLIVADIMEGTGRFNVAQGAVVTAQGIGAALSAAISGFVVVNEGYSAAFLFLAAVAAVAATVFLILMPETAVKYNPRPKRAA
jgi:MFS family permease